jgi:hypothetical protein
MGNVHAELTRRSPYNHKSTMYRNLFEDHFSYIRDLRSYRKSFSCSKCGKLWNSCWMLQRHERTSILLDLGLSVGSSMTSISYAALYG